MIGKSRIILMLPLLVCFMLNGCGKSADDVTMADSSTPPPSEQAASTPTVENDEEEYATNDMVSETPEPDEIDEQNTETMVSATADPTTENASTLETEANDMTGLIVYIVSSPQKFEDNGPYYDIYSVHNINPDTGEAREISRFCVVSNFAGGGNLKGAESVIIARLDVFGNEFSPRTMFSPGYDKMAVSQQIIESGTYNAGWIDQYGDFTDVAARTGNASTDFNLRSFRTLGFMPDGTFTYREQGNDAYAVYPVFSTDSETLSAAVEEDPWPKFYMCNQNYGDKDETVSWFGRYYLLTDWINDTECIADIDLHTGSVIVNTQTREATRYIPDTNVERSNWSGVLSPDGSKIAFMSMMAHGTDDPYIYIIPREGGEPVKISCDINFNRRYVCRILEWK